MHLAYIPLRLIGASEGMTSDMELKTTDSRPGPDLWKTIDRDKLVQASLRPHRDD